MSNIVRISDGLGNQMFQYAFARKLQLARHTDVYLDIRFINNEDRILRNEMAECYKQNGLREYGLNNFKISLPIADEHCLSRWDYVVERNGMKKMIVKLAQNGLWPSQYRDEDLDGQRKKRAGIYAVRNYLIPTYFRGYFFDLRYYNDIKPILQKEFQLKNPVKLPKELRRVLLHENTVSIHIRKGDYTKLHWDISRRAYYPKAVQRINELIKEPVYLLFSDDIEWVKNNLDIDGRKIYISDRGFQDYEEFTIMKHCKYNIVANSTFSYWAAYLNRNPDKIVIYPRCWKRMEIIPEEWIGI